MKYLLFLTLVSSVLITNAQDFKVYYETSDNGFIVFADNNEFCPVSVKIDFELLNMKSSKGNGKVFVVPSKSKKFTITELSRIKNGKSKFSYKTKFNYGDHNVKLENTDRPYYLPFDTGKEFKIAQGYNGTSTHQGKNALDFKMPIGTNITAIANGIIVRVIDTNNKTCYSKECEKFNNLISVYHGDGIFSEYVHINTNGALVKAGDKVTAGQALAKSGNIGRSSGPHLHLEVFQQKLENRKSLKTKFKVNDGNISQLLKQGKTYRRDY